MHVRKLLYLLMVEICVAVCNTAAQSDVRTVAANDTGDFEKSKSTYIQMDSENAKITDSVQDVTKNSKSAQETGAFETSTGTKSKNDFKKNNESTDLKKEKQKSETKESRTNSNKSDKTITDVNVAKENAIEETKAKVTIDEQVSTNGEKNQSDVGQSVLEANDEGTVESYIQEPSQEEIQDPPQEDIQEPETINNYFDSDYIVIKGNMIPLAYGVATQVMVDTYEVVQDTGLIQGTNNTFLFGHNDRSFSILDTVSCGETITINNYGVTKNYRVERSELAILSDDECDVIMLSDGNNVIFRDYGFPALVLITCARGYDWNYRWIIVASELG